MTSRDKIRNFSIVAHIDPDAYADALEAEKAERAELLAWMDTP